MKKLSDIRMRDPYIITEGNQYYLYGTIGETEGERNLYVFKSDDLENWSEPTVIFTLSDDSWAEKELWAPEVHKHNDKFYLFISIHGKNGLRGVQIAVSDTPDGMFLPVANRPANPLDKSCIDGTLYVEDGVPYMVYSRDWPDNYDSEQGVYIGQVCAIQLSDDLSGPVGDDFILFESPDAVLSAGKPVTHDFFGETVTRYGSDGPFIVRGKNGSLILMWSPIPEGNYIIASAVSKSGKIRGEWTHHTTPIFANNGGHAMIFKDINGNHKLCFHYPEIYFSERPKLVDIEILDDTITVK